MTKMGIKKRMDSSHRERFADAARSQLLKNPGMAEADLAAAMEFRYDAAFSWNLVDARHAREICEINGVYYPDLRQV